MRIDAGGPAAGGWLSDADYSSGTITTTTALVNTSHAGNPAPLAVYQSNRWGPAFTYVIPKLAPAAPYTVRLHFAETYWNAQGKRAFNVSINKAQVLTGFDIWSQAGAANSAIVKQYSTVADSSGKITIAFAATVDNAIVSGIEVIPGSSGPTPAPSPKASPTASPTATPTTGPVSTEYPIYSSMFTAANNPFHMTYNQLRASSNQVSQPSNPTGMSNNFFSQGVGYQTVRALPFYQGESSYPSYVISCTAYSSNGCSAQGQTVHLPVGWLRQDGTDRHVTIVDIPGQHEDDMWGGYNNSPNGSGPNECTVNSGNKLNCSWGGDFKFSTKGLQSTNKNGSGVAGGMAEGLFEITAGDLLSGTIKHALGVQGICLDDTFSQTSGGSVYPSSRTSGTDNACSSHGRAGGAPPYGAMWHVKNSVNVASLGYGTYCREIVQAMQTYGLYFMDSGNNQIQVEVENPLVYNLNPYKTNPFYTKIFPEMVSSGDGTGSGDGFAFKSCLNRLSANDFEIYYAPNLGF